MSVSVIADERDHHQAAMNRMSDAFEAVAASLSAIEAQAYRKRFISAQADARAAFGRALMVHEITPHPANLVERIREVAEPLVAAGLEPDTIRKVTRRQLGAEIGQGGSGPLDIPRCPYCGACGGGGHGGLCPAGAS